MKEEIIKCPKCGEEIYKDNICQHCLNSIDENNYLSKNHDSYNYVIEDINKDPNSENLEYYSKVFPIRRFFLLTIFTWGIFVIYWFYKNSKLVFDELKLDKNSYFRTFLFLLPIINIIAYYYYLRDMNKLLENTKLETFSTGWNLIFYIFCPLLNFWSMINIQEHFNEYWRFKYPERQILLSFKDNEKVAISIIPIFIIVLTISTILFYVI